MDRSAHQRLLLLLPPPHPPIQFHFVFHDPRKSLEFNLGLRLVPRSTTAPRWQHVERRTLRWTFWLGGFYVRRNSCKINHQVLFVGRVCVCVCVCRSRPATAAPATPSNGGRRAGRSSSSATSGRRRRRPNPTKGQS